MEDVVMAAILVGIPSLIVLAKILLSHREKMARIREGDTNPGVLDSRLARMELAIESMAIEVERVSEGQRFVTKLLSDRSPLLSKPGAD
ncbi:MAG TPA: hypothetical protein VIB98_09715 [Gemmatimonadaceae bacterium]|jgi:hypothetical protein